jgi:hypothetical protein
MRGLDITRRDVLAGIGATGLAALGALGVGTGDALVYTASAQMGSGDGFTLNADWRETYNGQVLEDTRANVSSDGAVISLNNVLPGDSGTFSFRFEVVPDSESDSPSVEPRLSLNLTETAENGINEPEEKAGDGSPNTGELQDYVDVKLWYDEGLANYPVLGGGNATQDLGESLITDDDGAEGTLAEVSDAVDDVPLDRNGCLNTDETLTVTFGWEFPSGDGSENVVQGDSVTFDLEVYAVECVEGDA